MIRQREEAGRRAIEERGKERHKKSQVRKKRKPRNQKETILKHCKPLFVPTPNSVGLRDRD